MTPAENCEERKTLLGSTLWTGAIVGYAVGGALAALSVTLFVLDGQSEKPNTGVACAAGPLNLSCHGRF
jgi:hypothetical protein